jgi:adenylate cyclase
MNRLRQLIHEIHRRTLWQVLLIYVGASWLVLSVVDTLGGAWNLPSWFPSFAFALLLLGLPIVLATAFVQEGGPHRYAARDAETGEVPAPTSRLFTWRNAFGGGVLAFALWGVVAAGWVLFGGGTRGAFEGEENASVEQSVAVLPFVNMSGDPENEYFSDGITEELLNALAQIPDLRVPARTSSFAFKGQNIPVGRIADTLNVVHILEGSVRRDGERVAITAQLVNAETDTHLWSETFERDLDDIFAIQREIATAIAEQLQITLSGEDRETLVADATESAEAHEAYLRGRYLLEQRTQESLENAIQDFTRATELDPEYAEAFAGLADTYVLQASFLWIPDVRDFRERTQLGLAASERATELAPDLGMAFPSRGFGLWNLGEWEAAERAFQEGIRLNPQYALTHQWYGLLLFTTGREEEGVAEARRAVDLDPLYRQGYRNLAWALEAASRLEEAADVYEELVSLAPDWWVGWNNYAALLMQKGDWDASVAAGLEAARLVGYDVEDAEGAFRAMVRYMQTGEPQMAEVPDDWVGDDITVFYARTGQPDRALENIEESVRSGRIGVTALNYAMGFPASLVEQPGFQILMGEAGIIQ